MLEMIHYTVQLLSAVLTLETNVKKCNINIKLYYTL